jgi:hypothetical protein
LGRPAPGGFIVDGRWKGTYACNADIKKLSMILDETQTGTVTGEAFIDYQEVVLGNPILLTGRANVTDASRKKGSDDYAGHLQVLDHSQGLGDFDFTLTLDPSGEKLKGALLVKDQNGAVKTSCDTDLDKTDVND